MPARAAGIVTAPHPAICSAVSQRGSASDRRQAAAAPLRERGGRRRPAPVSGQAGASASCIEVANSSGPFCAAAGSIHMTCQPWPSRSKKLREHMKP